MEPTGFVAEVHLEGSFEVLQIPIVRPEALLAGAKPRRLPPLLGAAPAARAASDGLEALLQRVGPLLGRDPTKWEQTGAPAVVCQSV